MDDELGAMVILDKEGTTAVRVVLPEIPPEAAVIVADPFETAVANPLLLMVATDELEEVQDTEVKFLVVPLEYVPVALNC